MDEGDVSASQLPCQSRSLKFIMKSISRGFTKRRISHCRSVSRIYLAKQDNMGRNRNGRGWELKRLKTAVFVIDVFILSELQDSILNPCLDMWLHHFC
jgi:hypothetical protein